MTISKADVSRVMKNMALISDDGCRRGFYNILPLGLWMIRCVTYLTDTIKNNLNVHSMRFPYVFPSNTPEIITLTKQFHDNDEIFYIASENMAMSYGPDPNFLLWLQHKKIDPAKLPYALEVPGVFLRKTKNGGVNGLDRVRQFEFPVVYTLTKSSETEKSIYVFLTLAADFMRLLFFKKWKIKITVVKDFYDNNKSHFDQIEKITGVNVIIKFQPTQTRYFSYKLGFYGDAGYDDLMIFNLQWDNQNSKLFHIKINNNEDDLVIVHQTLAGAINRLLPSIIGGSLSSNVSVFNPIIAPYHVGIIYDKNNQDDSFVLAICERFAKNNIRYLFIKDVKMKHQKKMIDQYWIPYVLTIDSNDTAFSDLSVIDRLDQNKKISLSTLENRVKILPTTCEQLFFKENSMELPF